MTSPKNRPIALIGFMACGKTAVGAALAARLGWEFVDTDARIQEHEGRTITEIFRDDGEAHFRRLESHRIAEAIRPNVVISAGGGAFLSSRNRRILLDRCTTVWLDAPLEVLRERLGHGGDRPLWEPSNPAGQRALFERRRAVYALAVHRIQADARPIETLVSDVLAEIH